MQLSAIRHNVTDSHQMLSCPLDKAELHGVPMRAKKASAQLPALRASSQGCEPETVSDVVRCAGLQPDGISPPMLNTALALPNQQPQRIRDKEIRGKMRVALNAMVWEGLLINEAAIRAGLTTTAIRYALQRPHVLEYLRRERQVLRASVCSRNELVLAEVRDNSENSMARIAAVKALEQIDNAEMPSLLGRSARSPGVIIVIGNQSADIQHIPDASDKQLIDHISVQSNTDERND
jgi:hypothetical protein